MSLNILDSFGSALSGPLVRQLSSLVGEPEDSTRAVVQASGPTVLASLMQQVAKPSGAVDVYRAISDDRLDDNIVGKLSSVLGNRGSLDSLAQVGESMGRSMFGNRGGAVVEALSSVSGVKSGSALKLLSIAVPVILGIVRKYMKQNNLGAAGLASLLFNQRETLAKTGLDGRITNALGFGSLSGLLDSLPRDADTISAARTPVRAPIKERDKGRTWLPWAIAAGVAALALMIWTGNRSDRRDIVVETATMPATQSIDRSETTSVYFDRGEVALSNDDRQTIIRVAEAVKSEARPVAITGYTDRTGNPDQNAEIAKDRAIAVREALVAEGIDELKIVMDPPAVVTGSNQDAEARRVDIQVR